MKRETSALRATGDVLLRLVFGTVIGGVLGGAIALVGFGLARELDARSDPDPIRMTALGGGVTLALPVALALVRVYSSRERWSSAGRTFTLFPGAIIGALAAVAALTVGWVVTFVLHLTGLLGPTQTSTQIVLGGAVLGAALAVLAPRVGRRRWLSRVKVRGRGRG